MYYKILSEMTGTDIRSEYQLISIVREMARQKREYESVASAVASVKQTGIRRHPAAEGRDFDGRACCDPSGEPLWR